jgi:K+-transporting ATPase ATPase C chain
MLRRQLVTGLRMTIAMIVLVGIAYPLVVTGIAQGLMSHKADGSFVSSNGKVVGSSLLGQNFTDAKGNPLPQYFQPRPSAAGADGYDAMASGGSNLGPSSKTLLNDVAQRIAAYRKLNDVPANVEVPVDAVTASASGLDPGISVANARLQAPRVAAARGMSVSEINKMIDAHTDDPSLGVLGEKAVNVLELNLALDKAKAAS